MRKKKKTSTDTLSEKPAESLQDSSDKKFPNPDDPNEEIGPPTKEMPIKTNSHHPHHEEILDGIPK